MEAIKYLCFALKIYKQSNYKTNIFFINNSFENFKCSKETASSFHQAKSKKAEQFNRKTKEEHQFSFNKKQFFERGRFDKGRKWVWE